MFVYIIDMSYINRFYSNTVEVGIGSMIMSGVLKRNKCFVHYCDIELTSFDGIKEIVEDINHYNPNIVSFTTRCDNYLLALEIAKQIKLNNNEILIVFSGPQATHVDEETLKNFKQVDLIIRNEGEFTTIELINAIKKKKDLEDIQGITYRTSDEIKRNKSRTFMSSIIFPPDYSIVPNRYILNFKQQELSFRIEAGRGCPYNCTFCSTSKMWDRKYRLKTAWQVYSEMSRLNRRYGITRFIFEHDNLTANKNAFDFFLNKMGILNKEKFQWKCSSRIDCLTVPIIEKMKSAGCEEIYFGIESGSEKMQRVYGKNLKFDNLFKVFDSLNQKNIFFTCSFICGHPEENQHDLEKTLLLMVNCKVFFGCTNIQLHRLSPINGSKLYSDFKNNLVLDCTRLSDQTGKILTDYELKLIKNYPHIFSSYYGFNISENMQLLFDKAINYGVKTISDFPITIYFILQSKNKKIIDLLDWKRRDFESYIGNLKNELEKARMLDIFKFECKKADFCMKNSKLEKIYYHIDIGSLMGGNLTQSIYLKKNKKKNICFFCNSHANLMKELDSLGGQVEET